jgi:hypothetical protein
MNDINQNTHKKQTEEYFTPRLDFYWQSISVYAIVLIIYSILRGSIENWEMKIILIDPVVILLSLFIVGSALGLIFNLYKNKTIIIGKDFIVFKSRFGERKYLLNDIQRISLGKEKIFQFRGAHRMIRIKLNDRPRLLKIRPSSFWDDRKLVNSMTRLRKSLDTRIY